jgi:hypothetical protein
MGWSTETCAGIIFASPPPDGPVRVTWSSAPGSGFQAAATAGFRAGAIDRPGNRDAFARSIAEGSLSGLTLDRDDTTRHHWSTIDLSGQSVQSRPHASCYGSEIRTLGVGAGVIWRYEP